MVGSEGLGRARHVANPVCTSMEFLDLIANKASLDKRPDVVCPGAVVVPKQAGVRIRAEPGGSNAVTVYPWRPAKAIDRCDKEGLLLAEVDNLYSRIVNSRASRRALCDARTMPGRSAPTPTAESSGRGTAGLDDGLHESPDVT